MANPKLSSLLTCIFVGILICMMKMPPVKCEQILEGSAIPDAGFSDGEPWWSWTSIKNEVPHWTCWLSSPKEYVDYCVKNPELFPKSSLLITMAFLLITLAIFLLMWWNRILSFKRKFYPAKYYRLEQV